MIDKPRELSSWKEICAYLGVSERAAQLWETRRGLPVHRLPGPGRGRVLAYTDEIDAWKRSAPPESAAVRAQGHRWAVAIGLLVVAILAVAWLRRPVTPAAMHMDKETLIALDEDGRELWRRVFPEHQASERYPETALIDLDEDGHAEILVAYRPANQNQLVCLDRRGQELWRYRPGRAVQSQSRDFENSFGIQAFLAAPMGRERKPRIAVSANHSMFSPAQVSLLDAKGRVLREYWHPGHLNDAAVADLDGDGAPELYLAGTNNRKGTATIIVLDADRFAGSAADEDGRPYFAAMPRSHEIGRVLLPRTELSRRCWQFNAPTGMTIQQQRIQVGINENPGIAPPDPVPSIIYDLSPALEIVQATLSDGFVSGYGQPCGGIVPKDLRVPAEDSLTRVVTVTPRILQASERRR